MPASVAELCEQQKVSVADLVSRTGLDDMRLSAIILGRWTPSPAERQKIAAAFNLTNRSNVRTLRNTQFSYTAATNRLTQASLNPVTGFQSPSAVVGPRTYQFAAKILF